MFLRELFEGVVPNFIMDEETKARMIEEIKEMRMRRLKIKLEMQTLSEHRDEISDLSFNQKSTTQNYASSVRRESDAEMNTLKEITKNLKIIESKKREVISRIVMEINTYRNQQMPEFLSVQTKSQKTRTEFTNIIKQLSSALLELKPNDEMSDDFRRIASECSEKSVFIVNKQRELAQSIDEMFNLMGKRFEVNEAAWKSRVSDEEGLKVQIARRRTSDLPSF